ncbi:50S ribosome-binding GTPase [Patescibacteria group bacterium]|jgi:tRNA U34 5-carboxymethylaminomethyl modifying GTPase MnmE/TrmE|nr:50S ribosome-binding GTPase [Patescibacteria group bacterium]
MMIEFMGDNPSLKDAQDELARLKQEHSGISFAIVGKPNAGKSTMLNTFV